MYNTFRMLGKIYACKWYEGVRYVPSIFFFIKAWVFVKAAYKISGTYLILVGLCIRDQKN